MNEETYTVRTTVFEGPLDVLLALIEKRKLLINDISLARVTDDFIEHVNVEGNVPLAHRAHFVLIAATLLLIKSKSLIPALELSEEEQESVHDLERRLKLHKRCKELARGIDEQFGASMLFSPHERQIEIIFAPAKDMGIAPLHEAIQGVLMALPKQAPVSSAVVEHVVSLEAMIDELSSRISKSLTMSFTEFSGNKKEKKVDVIVGFLAMLELVKQGAISVTQHSLFSDITMESEVVSTPHYS